MLQQAHDSLSARREKERISGRSLPQIGHAGLEIQRAEPIVGRLNIGEILVHHTPERILNGLLLELVLLGVLARWGALGDTAVGDSCEMLASRVAQGMR